MKRLGGVVTAILLLLCSAIPVAAKPHTPPPPQVGTTFPPGFPVIENFYLGVPVIGFGAQGKVNRVPVIFLHGKQRHAVSDLMQSVR